jgi:hypothetical protein
LCWVPTKAIKLIKNKLTMRKISWLWKISFPTIFQLEKATVHMNTIVNIFFVEMEGFKFHIPTKLKYLKL